MSRQILNILLSCIIVALAVACGDEMALGDDDDASAWGGEDMEGVIYPDDSSGGGMGLIDTLLDDDDDGWVQPEDLEQALDAGEMIPPEMIRVEDSINLFEQGLPDPEEGAGFSMNWRVMQYGSDNGDKLVAQFGIKGALNVGDERGSLNAVILIDKSGSMNDEGKIDYAREAAKNFISQLGPNDTISLIAFSSELLTIFDGVSGAYARELINQVDQIDAYGVTNIGLALETGFDALAEHTSDSTSDYFLLLTDGVPTAGITSTDELTDYADTACGSTVTVSTIGFGDDADELLMQGIAENCSGRYNFAANTADLQEVFIEEAQAAILAAAENVIVNLLADDNLPPFSHLGYRNFIADGNLLTVGVGNVPSESERVVIIEWPLFDTAVTAGSVAALVDYYETGGDVLQRSDMSIALQSSTLTVEQEAMLMRNVALGHLLTFFIDIGERVVNLDQNPTPGDLATIRAINTEMDNALSAGSNSLNRTFNDFAELGQMYERLLIDAL